MLPIGTPNPNESDTDMKLQAIRKRRGSALTEHTSGDDQGGMAKVEAGSRSVGSGGGGVGETIRQRRDARETERALER